MTNRRTLASFLGTLALAAATAMPPAALAAVGPLELLKDIQAGATGSFPSSFVVAGNTVYFVADDGVNGSELWKSDGTPAGTVLVKDIRPGASGSSPAQLAMAGGTLFFRADDGVNGAELWKSDGTGAGTVMVKDINPGAVPSSPTSVTAIGNTVFFAADTAAGARELWKSDGTGPGTVTVAEISPGTGDANPRNFAVMNGTLFFVANDPVAAAELFKSDGTVEGTLLVKDIRPGNFSSNLTGLVVVGGTLFFWASDGTTGMELWKSDGTDAGTVRVKDITAGAGGTSFGEAVAFDGRLFFVVTDATSGSELWTSDGTEAGTTLFKEIAAGAAGSSPATLTVSGSRLFFVASDGTTGRELWASDGTPGGTALVKDINPSGGSFPASLVPINGIVYFAADDGTAGREVWRSDGTAVGTSLLAEVVPGATGGTPSPAVLAGGRLFLTAVAAEGFEPWVVPVGLPDPMSFPAVPPTSGMVDSFAPVTITGVDHLVSISVERVFGLPNSDPEYSIGCTGTWTSLPALVGNGQTVCVRHFGGGPTYPSGGVSTQSVLVVGPSRITFASSTLFYGFWNCTVSSSWNGTAWISAQGRACGLSPFQSYIGLLPGDVVFILSFDPDFQRPYEWHGPCAGTAGSDTTCLVESAPATGSIAHDFTYPTNFFTLTSGPGTVTTDPPLEVTGFGAGWWPNAKHGPGMTLLPLRPVSMTAVPQPGAVLVSMSYNLCQAQDCSCDEQAGTCTAKVRGNVALNNYIGTHTVFGYELGIARAGVGAGSVNAAGATKNVDCGAACTVAFPAGDVVTLTPSPEAGSGLRGLERGRLHRGRHVRGDDGRRPRRHGRLRDWPGGRLRRRRRSRRRRAGGRARSRHEGQRRLRQRAPLRDADVPRLPQPRGRPGGDHRVDGPRDGRDVHAATR